MTDRELSPKRFIGAAMHPMWLIIKEDTVCAERTPPWGAASIQDYSKRLERNLQTLETTPQAKLNYDFSAAELEDVKALYPTIAQRMKEAVHRGQLAFVNGTYSQPHLHMLSLEASIRQFQVGVRSILDNFGYRVRTYLMQEPGYTDQTPQVLKAYGYRFAHRGGFITRQQTLEGQNVAADTSFGLWRGMDGTEIPAVQAGTGIEFEFPDLEEFQTSPNCVYVLVDDFLSQKDTKDHATRPGMRMYVPWGYIEGSNADELSRLDAMAETALVQMETLSALAKPAMGWPIVLPDPERMWKTWLLAQHHDAYWTGGPELRAKCCSWLRDLIRESNAVCSAMLSVAYPDSPGSQKGLSVFGVYPKKHQGATVVPWTGKPPELFLGADGRQASVQLIPTGPDMGKLLVPFNLAGAGHDELTAHGELRAQIPLQQVTSDWSFANRHYSATMAPDGSIMSLRTAGGTDLLGDSKQRRAADLAAASELTIEYVREWQVVGMFPGPQDACLDVTTPVEQGFVRLGIGRADLTAKYPSGDDTITWRPMKAWGRGLVKIDDSQGSAKHGSAYAYAEIEWPLDEDVVVAFNWDIRDWNRAMRVWLNGQAVLSYTMPPAGVCYEHQAKLRMRKGVNRILIRIDACQLPWGFSVRFQKGRKDASLSSGLSSARLWKGPVADIFEARGKIGTTPASRRLYLYHDLPWFEMEIECDFQNTSLGDFFDDTSKLALRWPMEEGMSLVHGIGGGAIAPDEPQTVFYPVPWFDMARGPGGLATVCFGTLKHCRKDETLYTVLAWGGDTDQFNNRIMADNWGKRLDLRLNGKEVFRFACYPHDGDWQQANVPDLAMSLLRPPVARESSCPPGRVSGVLLSLEGNLIPTSVFSDGKKITCRAYEPYGVKPEWTCNYLGKIISPEICDVAGAKETSIGPWRIANIIM